MHASDPVQWHPWNKETIQKAKIENKPLLLSLGYFSCYWCHVMQKENYQNQNVADLINEHFIPVIIDRELYPALDTKLNAFVEELIGYAGWPLHVFLTPEGYPFLGAVYLPKPRFIQWLKQVNTLWQEQSDYLSGIAKDSAISMQATQALKQRTISEDLVNRIESSFVSGVKERWDEMEGGFGVENKFPLPTTLETLLSIAIEKNHPELLQFISLTLDNMAYNGLRDPLDGGFFRYTSDPSWQVPHFEKMLYDNALLAKLYLVAGQQLSSPEYTRIGLQTIDFMINKMQIKKSGFASAFSAVGESGEEGEYYLWQRDKLKSALPMKEFKLISKAWGLDKAPVIEGGYLPTGINYKTEKLLRPILDKLESARLKKHLPRDEKLITSWNALALLAIAEAVKVDKKYRQTGNQIANFLSRQWTEQKLNEKQLNDEQPDKKQLSRAMINTRKVGIGILEDYAYTASALHQWTKFENKSRYIQTSHEILQQAWKLFFTSTGWQVDSTPITPYITSQVMTVDGPLPSPSAMLIATTLANSDNTQMRKSQDDATVALGVGHELLKTDPFWYASQLQSLRIFRSRNKPLSPRKN